VNLALKVIDSSDASLIGTEIPFYQIGAEQGFLPKVVRVQTGEALELNGANPTPSPGSDPTALLLGLAERADVIVDFRYLPNGTVVQMTNTAPDAPFGGFPDDPADPSTTGQVMQFVVNNSLTGASKTDPGQRYAAKDPWKLVLPAEPALPSRDVTRDVSLNELESEVVCVLIDAVTEEFLDPVVQVPCDMVDSDGPGVGNDIVPFGPTEALLGLVNASSGIPLKWTDSTGNSFPVEVNLNNKGPVTIKVTENPKVGDTEEWEIYNFTADAHPIHLHLVRFEVVKRRQIDGTPGSVGGPAPDGVQPWESGFKDTVIAYPGEITTVKATFDMEGLYVWHCHIVEHEDNEMMRPFVVSAGAEPLNKVTSFVLYDADTDLEIGPLTNGAMLDIAGKNINIEAVVSSPENGTQSVVLSLSGSSTTNRTENVDPYMLFGDNGAGDIYAGTLSPGGYTLTATPYSSNGGGGSAGMPLTIHFTVGVGGPTNNQITGFVLYNASTNLPVPGFVLNGLTNVDLSEHCNGKVDGCNVRAVATSEENGTQSIRLNLDGGSIPPGSFRNENGAPYFLGGDTGGDVFPLPIGASYIGGGLTPGSHTVNATPYTGNNGGGSAGSPASVTFTVDW